MVLNPTPLHRVFLFLYLLLMVVSGVQSQAPTAQITLTVEVVPAETPAADSLFLVGTFNNWNPGDKRYVFQRHTDGKYTLHLPASLLPFEYKVTRGSWETVEGDIQGKKIADRSLTKSSQAEAYKIQVVSWEDLAKQKGWNIIVTSLPENTPYQTDVFISGSFNNWQDHDSEYKLTPLTNGTYGIRIPKNEKDTLWFKFHRGSWQSVECRANGRTQQNHIAAWQKGEVVASYAYSIEAWEDLAGGTNAFFSFWLLSAILNCVVVLLAVALTRNNKKEESLMLGLILATTCIVLLGRLASYNHTVFEWWPHLLVVADMGYLILAPLYLLFLFRLANVQLSFHKALLFIPCLIQLIFYFPVFLTPRDQFVSLNLDNKFGSLFGYTSVAGCVYSVVLFVYCFYQLQKTLHTKRLPEHIQYYVTSIMITTGGMVFIWLCSLIALSIGNVWQLEVRLIHEYAVDIVWVLLATLVYVHLIQLFRFPYILRQAPEVLIEDDKKTSPHAREDLETLKEQLEQVMKKRKPYLNAKLGLQDLADAISVNMHTLSWVINEGYKKNFFDFVNEYRIEEFKRLVNHDQYKHYTFLALALEVGFSSKTTFNRAFKKFTGKTPREFFGSAQEAQLEGC